MCCKLYLLPTQEAVLIQLNILSLQLPHAHSPAIRTVFLTQCCPQILAGVQKEIWGESQPPPNSADNTLQLVPVQDVA